MAGLVLNGAPTVGPGPWLPSTVVGTSSTVFAEGQQIIVLAGDSVVTHIKPGKSPSPISGVVIGKGKVLIEGKQAAQIGDICSAGEILCKSADSVFTS